MVTISFEKAYLVPYGLLKAIEFITLLIGWAIFVDLTSGTPWPVHPRVKYFIAIGIISWLFVIVWFVLCVLKVTNEMKLSPKNLWFAGIHFVMGVLQLIGACCVANTGGHYTKIDMGIAFGFIGSFVLIFDGVVHIVLGKNYYGGATVTATVA